MPEPSQRHTDPQRGGRNDGAGKPDPSDVRAGPGDAGRQDRPTALPDDGADRADTWRRAITLGAAAVVVALLIGFFL
ncbi:hypothetical protein [Meridianimarinicoccus roseus]|nr:hypothetical protein [Meridianimarinicoccus roseus]